MLLTCRLISTIVPTTFRIESFDAHTVTTNPTFLSRFHVWIQVGMHLSTVSATVLILRPIMLRFNTSYGALGPSIAARYGEGSDGAYAMSSLEHTPNAATKPGRRLVKPMHVSNATAAHERGSTDSQSSILTKNGAIIRDQSWRIESSKKGMRGNAGSQIQ